jgi:small subunit ribosomal protein S13
MARIAGIDLPNKKRLEIALTYIYGIGRPTSQKILGVTGIPNEKRVHELTEGEVADLRREIEGNFLVEGELRRKVKSDIDRLKSIKSYRGIRHAMGLPVRGQKTRSNARSWKGPRASKSGGKKRR